MSGPPALDCACFVSMVTAFRPVPPVFSLLGDPGVRGLVTQTFTRLWCFVSLDVFVPSFRRACGLPRLLVSQFGE